MGYLEDDENIFLEVLGKSSQANGAPHFPGSNLLGPNVPPRKKLETWICCSIPGSSPRNTSQLAAPTLQHPHCLVDDSTRRASGKHLYSGIVWRQFAGFTQLLISQQRRSTAVLHSTKLGQLPRDQFFFGKNWILQRRTGPQDSETGGGITIEVCCLFWQLFCQWNWPTGRKRRGWSNVAKMAFGFNMVCVYMFPIENL